MSKSDLIGIAPPGTYDRVLDMIRPLKGLQILDVPCGSGGFVEFMAREGALCHGMDIMPPPADKENLLVGDMNKVFPFDDSSFNLITCIEGIEHVENIFCLAREFYRVLMPGGRLIITTPNIQSLRSRLKFLLRGTFFWFDTYEIKRIGHINFIPFFLLRHAFTQAGFTDISTYTVRNAFPALPAWACWIMRAVFSKNMGKDALQNSVVLINAENLMLTVRKP